MAKKGIFAVDPRNIERIEYASVEDLAQEICDWVMRAKQPATIQTTYSWWAGAVVSPYVGDASNWSIGFPEEFEIDDIFSAIRARGLFVSYVCGYCDWVVVDVVEHEDYPAFNCILPE